MKQVFKKFIACLLFLFTIIFANAQIGFFTDIAARTVNPGEVRTVAPEKSRSLALDTSGLLNFFKTLSPAKEIIKSNNEPVIEIPMPDGTTNRFRIWESSIMEPALAAKFPAIKTYT